MGGLDQKTHMLTKMIHRSQIILRTNYMGTYYTNEMIFYE